VASTPVAILRGAYEAFARDGVDGLLPLLDDAIEWRNPEDSPNANVWLGHQGVREHLALVNESFDEIRFLPDEFDELVDGRVLVRLRFSLRAKQSGVPMEVPLWHLVTLRDGLVTHFFMYSDQQRALQAAGLHGAE